MSRGPISSLKKTAVLSLNSRNISRKKIGLAVKVLKRGGLVAFPTETVYGLGASLVSNRAIARLYKVKRRPANKPFTVHIAGTDAIQEMGCMVTGDAKALIKKFWPGPLTIILNSASGAKIGFRMPDNKIALALIKASGAPIIAPSANLSGSRPPKSAGEVLKQLDGKIDLLIDGGRTRVGVESTVVDMTVRPPAILREGAISRKRILSALRS